MADLSVEAISYVIEKEGYRSNRKTDPGGLTIWGISEKYYPDHVFKMKNMDREDSKLYAKGIYFAEIWTPSGLWRLKHKPLTIKLLSLFVLLGSSRGVKLLQEACNLFGAAVMTDGDLGPKTAEFINSYKYPKAIEEAFEANVTQYLKSKGHKADFIAGWLMRVDEEIL